MCAYRPVLLSVPMICLCVCKFNISDNCLDRQVERHPDRVAFIWDKDEPGTQEKITYK